MNVNKIFYSLQGEGVYVGLPTVFIRLAGCNLDPKCHFCDTSYAWNPKDGKERDILDILTSVGSLSAYRKPWVCITGGEPLWQKELEFLAGELKSREYPLTIETNGSFEPPEWYDLVDSWNADIKCPSSGVCGVSDEAWFCARREDQIKFVVGTTEDLDFTRKMLDKHRPVDPQVLVSPITGAIHPVGMCWDQKWLQEVAEFCKDVGARYSLQLHKILWGDKKGV